MEVRCQTKICNVGSLRDQALLLQPHKAAVCRTFENTILDAHDCGCHRCGAHVEDQHFNLPIAAQSLPPPVCR
jgi:hypothetical protein